MTYSQALARAKVLRESLLDHGVKQVSIELVEGRGSAGWSDNRFVGSLGHHIVSYRSQGLTPFLWLVKKGRVDLPGPICNGYGGFDEVARIICMGWANHPGRGGPETVELGTIPENNGRPYLFGWEFEGGVKESDWPDSMHEFMASCLAGTLDFISWEKGTKVTEKSHLEHKNWARPLGRKTDRLGYSLEEARELIAKQLGDTVITRASKADEGLDIFERDMEKARSLGFATVHTQPGGVAFNDEIIAILNRAGLLDFKATVQSLQSDLAAAHKQIADLKKKVDAGVGGGSLTPGTQFTAEVQ